MKRIPGAILFVALVVGGCAHAPPQGPAPAACQAGDYAGFIGAPLAATTFPAGVRVIGPDTIITEDFVPSRLNVLVDAASVITGFRCG